MSIPAHSVWNTDGCLNSFLQVDRLYKWQTVANSPIQDAMARQEEYVRKEFEDRYNQVGGGLVLPWEQQSCQKC